jgi:hypothetical protein
MTVYHSVSGKEVQSLPAPEAMDGVNYDANLKRIYMTGGRWYGTPEASAGWVYVYQQKPGLRLPTEGLRPLRADLQDQDPTRFGHFAAGTPVQTLIRRVSGNRRTRRRNIGVRTRATRPSVNGARP